MEGRWRCRGGTVEKWHMGGRRVIEGQRRDKGGTVEMWLRGCEGADGKVRRGGGAGEEQERGRVL